MLIENCQQHCVCHSGKGMVCQDHSCKPGQVCEPSGGVLTCVTKGAGQWGWAGEEESQGRGWEPGVGGGEHNFMVRGAEVCGLRCQTLGWDSRSPGQSLGTLS